MIPTCLHTMNCIVQMHPHLSICLDMWVFRIKLNFPILLSVVCLIIYTSKINFRESLGPNIYFENDCPLPLSI